MSRLVCVLLALALVGCTTQLAVGERRYREGDRLGALETWRSIPESSAEHDAARERIATVEEEFQRLVVRYKKRALYYEEKGRLAESILDYRLALKLQPGDAETLAHVQTLARTVVSQKASIEESYRAAFEASDLAGARREVDRLLALDPFDPELQSAKRQLRDALQAEVTRRLVAGRRAFVSGNHRAARRAFQSVLELEPHNESARGYLSYIATIQRETESDSQTPAALDPPETFASDAEIRAEGFYQNALAAERSGDPYAAIRHDLRALRADPNHRDARAHLRRLRRRLATRVEGLIEKGRDAFRDEDLQLALDLWTRALLVAPENERARAYVARAEEQLQNLERLRAEPDLSGGGQR